MTTLLIIVHHAYLSHSAHVVNDESCAKLISILKTACAIVHVHVGKSRTYSLTHHPSSQGQCQGFILLVSAMISTCACIHIGEYMYVNYVHQIESLPLPSWLE